MKTKVFDPYAEADFRTPTNQLEFDAGIQEAPYGRISPSSAAHFPRTPGSAGTGTFETSQMLGVGSRAQLTRDNSYATSITAIGDDEDDEKKSTPSYGHGDKI